MGKLQGVWRKLSCLLVLKLIGIAAEGSREEIVVIDTIEDVGLNPGWIIDPVCKYHASNPQLSCRGTPHDLQGEGFWESCDAQLCEIRYNRQPNETILRLQLESHQLGCSEGSHIYITLEGNGYSNTQELPNNGTLDLSKYVDVERITSVMILVRYSCPGYYYLDKVHLHKRHGELISTVDVEEDITEKLWRSYGGCLFQSNHTEFHCNGEPVPVYDEGYVGNGFWIACEDYCLFIYDVLQGETIKKLEIHALYNKNPRSGLDVTILPEMGKSWRLQFPYDSSSGFSKTIDFRDYIIPSMGNIRRIEVMLRSQDVFTKTHAMLDKLVLHKRLSTIP